MSETNTFNPNWVSAPGDTIADILTERGITTHVFAQAIQLSLDDTNKLLEGDHLIDDQLAQTLGTYFGISTQFWINREKRYRDGLAKGLKR
jgi:plasmid maintenance system antidote protein VapI